MPSRKELKQQALAAIKKHLIICILVCALGTLASGQSVFSDAGIRSILGISNTYNFAGQIGLDDLSGQLLDIASSISEDRIGEKEDEVTTNIEEMKEQSTGAKVFGRTRGVISDIINKLASGSFLLMFGIGLKSAVGSAEIAGMLLVLLAVLFQFLVHLFLRNIYPVIQSRMFLEGHRYKELHLSRMRFVLVCGHFLNIVKTMFLRDVLWLLWALTIVGGFVKYFSYSMIPYILAENPSIAPLTAITLSRQMMQGHKWELFRLRLSFIGWELLSSLTFGMLNPLFIVPYETAAITAFYAALRLEAREKGIQNADLLNDEWLYLDPPQETLDPVYGDVLVLIRHKLAAYEDEPLTKTERFLARNFGLTLRNTPRIQRYTKIKALSQSLYFEQEAYDRKAYPARLNAFTARLYNTGRHEYPGPYRSYSVWSIILMFFTVSVIGWVWEVTLHMVTTGDVVNRGVLQGPWLPIYGFGCILILLLLYRFRRNPALEFMLTMLLAGIIEYLTSVVLEVTKGARWWDYTGYFLNINGRICAEGLFLFGVGGLFIVYYFAPRLDDLIQLVRIRILIIISAVLLVLFAGDVLYSRMHPNIGKGITSVTKDS